LRAQIAPKPAELYDLPVLIDLNLIAGKDVAGFWNALHLEDLNLDNPAIVIAANPGNPFRGTPDKFGERIHRPLSELNTSLLVLCHVKSPRTVSLFRLQEPLDQLLFEAISFIIIDETGFSPSLDIIKSLLQGRWIQPLALSFLPNLLGNPSNAPDRGKRPGKKTGDQAHTGSPASSVSTNA
jgi:hypothetical protein